MHSKVLEKHEKCLKDQQKYKLFIEQNLIEKEAKLKEFVKNSQEMLLMGAGIHSKAFKTANN